MQVKHQSGIETVAPSWYRSKSGYCVGWSPRRSCAPTLQLRVIQMTREMVRASVCILGCASAFGVDVPATNSDWKAMLPMVQVAVRHQFPKVAAQAHYPASIKKTADLDQGVSVALVDLGTGGYT